MPRLQLFPFRYRDRVTGKWAKARYVAEPQEIAARYERVGGHRAASDSRRRS